jgi:hypothetical protein
MCGYIDTHRLYYSTMGLEPVKKRLASHSDFAEYAATLQAAGRLPDIWVLRAVAVGAPSREKLPDGEAADAVAAPAAVAGGGGGDGGSHASSARSSVQQMDFRDALLLRDASEVAQCALCDSPGAVQAAHIMPQGHSEQYAAEEGLKKAKERAGILSLYQPCNGFLLCDGCHDFFDAFLWSVDSERKVVVSGALAAHVPRLAGFAGKQLFPDDAAASDTVRRNLPLPGVWAWHFRAYERTTAARRDTAALKVFHCSRCEKSYALERRKDAHQSLCTATKVPPKNYATPARGGAGGGGDDDGGAM